jgi:hypothetical protein
MTNGVSNNFVLLLKWYWVMIIDIKSLQNRLLKFCYVPSTSGGLKRLFFAAAVNSTNEANKAGSMHH